MQTYSKDVLIDTCSMLSFYRPQSGGPEHLGERVLQPRHGSRPPRNGNRHRPQTSHGGGQVTKDGRISLGLKTLQDMAECCSTESCTDIDVVERRLMPLILPGAPSVPLLGSAPSSWRCQPSLIFLDTSSLR